MRLRKNMKRTAAAVLALSMAVSAAAIPASAGFNIDMSKVDGDVEITQVDDNGSAKVTIKVGSVDKTIDFSDGKEGNDVTITGDNTKPTATESLNAAEKNASEVEKSGETKTEGKDKTQNSAAEGEDEGDEPTSQELLAPEDEEKKDEEKKDEQKPADSQEPEQTEKTSDQVIEYGQYDPEAQKEAAKPAAEQETGEKKTAEEKSYEDTNAPTSLSESVQAAANNVVKIINKSAKALTVIFSNLKVDAGDKVNERGWGQNAVTVSGDGDVTLELEGKNELIGGSGREFGGNGISSDSGKLTIQGEEGSSLSATGGSSTYSGDSSVISGGTGISASGRLDLVNATVTATGGASSGRASGGNGMYTSGGLNIKNSKLTAKGGGQLKPGEDNISNRGGVGLGVNGGKLIVGEGSEVIAIGGDIKTVNREAQGGTGINVVFSESCEVQKGGKLTAIGGNAESESGDATGGDGHVGFGEFVSSGETMLIGGNAKSSSGNAAGGNANKWWLYWDAPQVTVKGGTTTALGGKAESDSGKTANGSSIKNGNSNGKIGLSVETGGTLVTAKPGEWDEKGNGIIGDVEIKTDGGKIEEMENAKVSKKEDGTVEVVGDLVGVETGNLKYELTETIQPTCTAPGKRVYTCTTEGVHKGEIYEEAIEALGHDFVDGVCTRCGAPEQAAAENGGSSAVTLTVTGAEAYETSMADGRYIIAVPAENAVLSGCLGNLKELKAQGVNTIVFRTQLRETALNIDSMLSLGVDDTLFTLTHSGESAELTVGGFAHNELLH